MPSQALTTLPELDQATASEDTNTGAQARRQYHRLAKIAMRARVALLNSEVEPPCNK